MEHLLSTNHCQLLKCALEVIGRTKYAEAIRITTMPVDDRIFVPANLATPKTDETNPPHSSQNECQDRVQRRKAKKRRKIELRKKHRELSTIKSEVVTSTSFCNLSTKSASPSPSDSQVAIPQSVRAIIHVKPLIILDVNGVLCHRLRYKSPASCGGRSKQIVTYRPSIGHIANTDIIPRSDLHQFLTSLNNSFSLAVWTSATRKTSRQLVRLLFPDEIRKNLVFIWHRNFCNLVDNTDKGKNHDSNDLDLESNSNNSNNKSEESPKKSSHEDLIAIKSLAKVWASYPIWNTTNTLLLDDSPEKCPAKYRKNALHPAQICGTNTDMGGAYFDNDEENQKNQRCFFELLAKHWSESSSSEYLSTFLEDNAKEYNMGWSES